MKTPVIFSVVALFCFLAQPAAAAAPELSQQAGAPERVNQILPNLFTVIRNGDTKSLRALLRRGTPVNVRDNTGTTPLMYAALYAGVAQILLDHGATVDQRDFLAGFTALHWAASAENGRADLVKLLLARGADPKAEGGQSVDSFLGISQTPLMLARKRGRTPIVEALLAANAKEALAETKKSPQPPLRRLPDRIDLQRKGKSP